MWQTTFTSCYTAYYTAQLLKEILVLKNFRHTSYLQELKKTHKSCSSLKVSQFLGAGLVTERNFEKKCMILTNSILQNNYVLTEYFHLTKQPKKFLHQGIADKHFTNTFFF